MLKLNAEQAEAVLRLSREADFKLFLSLVRLALDEAGRQLRATPDEVALRWWQGRAQAWSAVLEMEQQARKVVGG